MAATVAVAGSASYVMSCRKMGPSSDSARGRESASRVAKWLVSRHRPDEAVGLLVSWAVQGPNDREGQALLAEAIGIDPSAPVAQQAFERMEGIVGDHSLLDAFVAKYDHVELARLEHEAFRPSFVRAQVGFNNNVKYNGAVYHVQTEDSGLDKPHVITHLFADGGRVIKSHKRSYADAVSRADVADYVRTLMKGQHLEMAAALREGRFDEVIAGRAVGGMELFDTPPSVDLKKLATKRGERAASNTRSSAHVEAAEPVAPPPEESPPESSTRGGTKRSSKRIRTTARVGSMRNVVAAAPVAPPSPSFRLVVTRCMWGGPESYQPKGDQAVIGTQGDITLAGERFSGPFEALLRRQDSSVWIESVESKNGVFLRIRSPVEVEPGDELIVGDQLLRVDRNPVPNDAPAEGPTYFYSSPRWMSAFRVVQLFEGGGRGAEVMARGNTLQVGSVTGDFVFPNDPLISDAHLLIEEQAGTLMVTDLGSRTGVFLRIKGTQQLTSGDELMFGRTRLMLEMT